MRVVTNNGATYTIHDLVRDTDISVHVTRLKRFDYDADRLDPLSIAAKDYGEDEVEAIISHSGNPKRKSSLDFLVRWADETEDLWLPWSKLRLLPKLHDYLRANGMANLIPNEHK